MTAPSDILAPVPLAKPGPSAAHYVGEVVYLYAFDVAYEMTRTPVRTVLGHPVGEFVVDASKRGPRQLFFYRPQMVRLPAQERLTPLGRVTIERTVKLLPVGAISVMVRMPFEVDRIEDLVGFHDLRFKDGTFLSDEVRQLAEDVRRELEPHYVRPVPQLGQEEAYTVFCVKAPLDAPGHAGAEGWLKANRRAIASVLTEERDVGHLSNQEAEESTSKFLSYYDHDLVVIDWDAAIVVDEPKFFDETLYIMELANVQLAELEAYDRILDDAVERSYRDLAAKRPSLFRPAPVAKELRELRVDFARLSDELGNITKFFGDWHLARLYQSMSARFHLGEWFKTIDDKLKTLDDLYRLLQEDRNHRWMFILESTVVLLFVIEIVKSFVGH